VARKRRAVGSPVPEDLTAEQMDQLTRWATEKHPWALATLENLVEACLNHHRARENSAGITAWVAACRTWICNEFEWRQRRGDHGFARKAPAGRSGFRGGLAEAAREGARELGLFPGLLD